MGSLLETMFKPNKAPVSKYSQLEASYNEYVEARSTLQRLDINLPSEVDSFLLQQMVQVLANRREMQVTLGIPLAQLTIDGFEQTGAIEALICDTITEINNSPGKYKDPQVANPRKPGAANPVTPAPTSASTNSQKSTGKTPVEQQVCVAHRESSVNPEKCVHPNCKRKHTCSGKVCTHPLYK